MNALSHPPSAPVIPVGAVRPLLAVMEASGLVPGHVLRRAGLPADLFEQPDDALLRLSDYFRICEQMALQGGDESCHVSLRPLMVGTSELVQARLRGCGTMAEVMEVLANSYNIIHGHRYNQVQRRGHLISYAIDDADFPYAFDPGDAFVLLSLECLLVYVHVLLLSLAPGGAPIPLRAVRTRGPAAARGHLAFLGVPIRASAGLFGLDYDAALETVGVSPAQSPVLSARTIYGGVADMLDRIGPAVPAGPDLVGRVERELAGGRHDQAEVATALGMSVASLRRRLGEAGLQFRDVRARYLNSIARAALEDGNSIADIAESLGFSDGRSFARAFRQWNGVAPGDYRKTLV
ncbi:helix-turn-helix transcriptional regulator [Rhizorhabdus dicambivorans]|nr:helix-turn-helix transcriptional regulator [Rhizorhabdus dicambivorans]